MMVWGPSQSKTALFILENFHLSEMDCPQSYRVSTLRHLVLLSTLLWTTQLV